MLRAANAELARWLVRLERLVLPNSGNFAMSPSQGDVLSGSFWPYSSGDFRPRLPDRRPGTEASVELNFPPLYTALEEITGEAKFTGQAGTNSVVKTSLSNAILAAPIVPGGAYFVTVRSVRRRGEC